MPNTTPNDEGWRGDLPGMSYADFYERYGASCRTKNMLVLPSTARGRARFAARLMLGRLQTADKRFFSPPASSRLPWEFIRLDPWEAGYLYAVAQSAEHGVVEIGRFSGGSTFLLACANTRVPIWSIDLAPRDDVRLAQLFEREQTGANVRLLVGDSHRGSFPEIGQFDLLFVDGDHTRDGCLADLERFFPRLRPGGHVLVHDCYPDREVQLAVFDFISRSDVRLGRSPYIPSSHWHTSAGSIAHLVKPGAGVPVEWQNDVESLSQSKLRHVPAQRRHGRHQPRKTPVPYSYLQRQRYPIAALVGVVLFGVTAVSVEALTDRDWRLSGFEWPQDFLTAFLLVCLVAVAFAVARTLAQTRGDRRAPSDR